MVSFFYSLYSGDEVLAVIGGVGFIVGSVLAKIYAPDDKIMPAH